MENLREEKGFGKAEDRQLQQPSILNCRKGYVDFKFDKLNAVIRLRALVSSLFYIMRYMFVPERMLLYPQDILIFITNSLGSNLLVISAK